MQRATIVSHQLSYFIRTFCRLFSEITYFPEERLLAVPRFWNKLDWVAVKCEWQGTTQQRPKNIRSRSACNERGKWPMRKGHSVWNHGLSRKHTFCDRRWASHQGREMTIGSRIWPIVIDYRLLLTNKAALTDILCTFINSCWPVRSGS